MKCVILFLLVLVILPLSAQDFMPWQNLRNSSYTENNDMHLRAEIVSAFRPETDFFYSQGSGWNTIDLIHLNGITYEAVFPVDPLEEISCRFRTKLPNDYFEIPDLIPNLPETITLMMTNYIPNNPFPPPVEDLAYIGDDPVGDMEDGVPAYLDLTGQYFSYSDERFYSALTNSSGSFPTGPIIGPYNVYASLLLNPETAIQDTVFYAMVYSQIPVLLPPGLYRVTNLENPGLDSFQQIGSINHQVIDNTLVKSCSITDLVNDPGFGDWPNMSNTLVTVPATFRITLTFDFTFGDVGQPAVIFFENYVIEPFVNNLPEISNLEIYEAVNSMTINVTYFDENGNFPIVAELDTFSGEPYHFEPLGYSFDQPVVFSTVLPLENSLEGIVRFSDNGYSFVELPVNVFAEDNTVKPPSMKLKVYPNPLLINSSSEGFSIEIESFSRNANPLEVTVFNVRGQKIKSFSAGSDFENSLIWNGNDHRGNPVSSGVYLIRVQDLEQNNIISKKVMIYR